MPSAFNIYAGQRVLVTGHTGFKGAWLCEWLIRLGADVHGEGPSISAAQRSPDSNGNTGSASPNTTWTGIGQVRRWARTSACSTASPSSGSANGMQ